MLRCKLKKQRFIIFTVVMCGVLGLSISAGASVSSEPQVMETYGKLPLYFIENQGQVDGSIRYYEKTQGHTISFMDEGVRFSLRRKHTEAPTAFMGLVPLGMRQGVTPEALDRQEGVVRYYMGNDRSKWKNNIPTYGAVVYREAYPGIDLKFYGSNRQLEYDVIVKPGADPTQVRFLYRGIDSIAVTDSGDLSIQMKDGVVLTQHKPIVYQIIDGKRVEVEGRFTLRRDDSAVGSQGSAYLCGFELASYDKAESLIIDPVLVLGAYLGGEQVEEGLGVAVDAKNNIFVVGQTYSSEQESFPVKNAYQDGMAAAPDAFVTKYVAAGNKLVYSTFLGGDDNDTAKGAAVDATGNVYVVGTTASGDFPIEGGFQDTLNGDSDAFVAKFSDQGAVFITLLGGSGADGGNGIAVEKATGIVYVTGYTDSEDFPKTSGAAQKTFGGGLSDAFVTRIKTDGSAYTYSTYLGGSGNDEGNAVALDPKKNFYVTGSTNSDDFPTTAQAFQPEVSGDVDAFVTKFSSAGARTYSSCLGGSSNDVGTSIAVDADQTPVVVGYTDSDDFPVKTPHRAYGGGRDAFVTKVNATFKDKAFSTWLGGENADAAYGVALDAAGAAYVVGSTTSTDFYKKTSLTGQNCTEFGDAFITKFEKAGAIPFSSCLGGDDNDTARAAIVGADGNLYLAGTTWSQDFPTTQGAYRIKNMGESDAFIAKIGVAPPVAKFSAEPLSGMVALEVQFSNESTGIIAGTKYKWDFGDGGTSTEKEPSYTYEEAGTYTVKLTVTTSNGADTETKTNYITVTKPAAPTPDFTADYTSGNAPFKVKFTNKTKGVVTSYLWDFGDGTVKSREKNPIHTFKKTGTFDVTLTVEGPGGRKLKKKADYIKVKKGSLMDTDSGAGENGAE